jgi:hypothetical protein
VAEEVVVVEPKVEVEVDEEVDVEVEGKAEVDMWVVEVVPVKELILGHCKS